MSRCCEPPPDGGHHPDCPAHGAEPRRRAREKLIKHGLIECRGCRADVQLLIGGLCGRCRHDLERLDAQLADIEAEQ